MDNEKLVSVDKMVETVSMMREALETARLSNDEKLLRLYERGEFDEAIIFIDEHENVNPLVNNDYGLRYAIHNNKYEIVKELIKRGCKLSSVNYEAVNVFIEKSGFEKYEKNRYSLKGGKYTKEEYYTIFKFIFSNIDLKDPTRPTLEKILTSGDGIDNIQFRILEELGFVTVPELQKISNSFIANWNLEIRTVFDIFLKYNIDMPKPTKRILESLYKNMDILDYYYKNYTNEVIEYYKSKDAYKGAKLLKYIVSNNITKIFDCNQIFLYFLEYYDEVDIDFIEKYIVGNLGKINKLKDKMYIFCAQDYDGGLQSIGEEDVLKLKLLLKYDLIDIRDENDMFYHHAYITNSKEAIEFIDSIYTLTVKK
jgi:hypothetical protein